MHSWNKAFRESLSLPQMTPMRHPQHLPSWCGIGGGGWQCWGPAKWGLWRFIPNPRLTCPTLCGRGKWSLRLSNPGPCVTFPKPTTAPCGGLGGTNLWCTCIKGLGVKMALSLPLNQCLLKFSIGSRSRDSDSPLPLITGLTPGLPSNSSFSHLLLSSLIP